MQYNELGGIQDSERQELGGGGSHHLHQRAFQPRFDMPQYIHDNTDDELSHAEFLKAYLAAKGADTVDLERFRTLPSRRPAELCKSDGSRI